MNLKALQSLIAIHEAQSFQEAARRLGYNQSAISMQIKTLEEDLGVELFDRSVRPPSMTAAARALINPAREIVSLVQIIRAAAHSHRSLDGRLSVGVIPTVAANSFPDALVALRNLYPNVQIKVESGLSSLLIERVAGGSLDVAIVTEPELLPPELDSEVLVYDRLVLVSGSQVDTSDIKAVLAEQPFIRFSPDVGVGVVIERALKELSVSLGDAMELDSVDSIVAMVERNIGVSIVPEIGIGPSHRQRVFVTNLKIDDAARKISLIFPQATTKRPLITAISQSLKLALSKSSNSIK